MGDAAESAYQFFVVVFLAAHVVDDVFEALGVVVFDGGLVFGLPVVDVVGWVIDLAGPYWDGEAFAVVVVFGADFAGAFGAAADADDDEFLFPGVGVGDHAFAAVDRAAGGQDPAERACGGAGVAGEHDVFAVGVSNDGVAVGVVDVALGGAGQVLERIRGLLG